jgi:flagellar protein FliS
MSTNTYSPNANAYREASILTASRERRVVMLYDGAVRFLTQAAYAMRSGDVVLTHAKMRRGEAIVAHLQHTLDLSQGPIAHNLLSIYLFCRRHLNEARMERNPEKIDDVVRLLAELREAWDAICP